MIYLKFNLSNPWSDRWKIVYAKSKRIGLHKAFEFNVHKTSEVVEFDLEVTTRCSHAGARLMLSLFGYSVELHFYDTRHWDYELKQWETYPVTEE